MPVLELVLAKTLGMQQVRTVCVGGNDLTTGSTHVSFEGSKQSEPLFGVVRITTT